MYLGNSLPYDTRPSLTSISFFLSRGFVLLTGHYLPVKVTLFSLASPIHRGKTRRKRHFLLHRFPHSQPSTSFLLANFLIETSDPLLQTDLFTFQRSYPTPGTTPIMGTQIHHQGLSVHYTEKVVIKS